MHSIELDQLKKLATGTLDKLVTPDGIYASSAMGMEGLFHGFFGRDTAITAYLISQAEHLEQTNFFLWKAAQGLMKLKNFQSKDDNPEIGAEKGKFPHEIRLNKEDYQHLTTDLVKRGERSWYVDPEDKVMKNWDANDATQLWIIVICRMHEKGMVEIDNELKQAIKDGLLWCIRNLRQYHGFTGYKYNPHRPWNGCHNQTWKDSGGAYLLDDGSLAKQPIKDVFGSSLTWAALKYGEKLFAKTDLYFAKQLNEERNGLKSRFNSMLNGFLMYDERSEYYLADALDADNKQIMGISCDPGLALWAYCDGESIIEDKYILHIVNRLMMSDIFDKDAGIRTYSCEGNIYDPVGYHRSQHNFWPFVSALIADAFNHFGYKQQSADILQGMVKAVKQFNSCVELFVKKDNTYERFKHPYDNQLSCVDQAWTAGALYYATNYLKTHV